MVGLLLYLGVALSAWVPAHASPIGPVRSPAPITVAAVPDPPPAEPRAGASGPTGTRSEGHPGRPSAGEGEVQTRQFQGLEAQVPEGSGRPEGRFCEACGRPLAPGQTTCTHGQEPSLADRARELGSWALDRSRQALEGLRDPRLSDRIIDKLLQAKQDWLRENGRPDDEELAARREGLRRLGETRLRPDGPSVNDLAREAVGRYLPALEGTDFADDPVRVLSYYLVLDGKGFLRDVRFLRGPLGQPMTLPEAIEYHRRLDPGKAAEMLELLDDLQQLTSPDCPPDKVPLLLDGAGRTLKLLLK